MLGDEVMAAALIDRVLLHRHLVNIRGNSFRMREHTALRQTMQAEIETLTTQRPRRNKPSVAD